MNKLSKLVWNIRNYRKKQCIVNLIQEKFYITLRIILKSRVYKPYNI